ncbi:MAG TPA: class I SAM-dependent RNA methyltransferase [Bryobacteraceae bacterium]|nr:class I SAM-dependent RNA methyltransferase [Bryobacteraceae bacterium]
MPTEENFTIEKLVYGGDGLSRLDGKVVLTPYVLPGEVVRAEVEPVKKDLFRGRLIEVISQSASRVSPPCPYFQHCGGCHYQHTDPNFQVEQKRSILREALRRVGKIDFSGEIQTITGEPWGYRNRAQLHIEDGNVGYFEHGSHSLCPIERCVIASPALNEAISKLKGQLLENVNTTIELFTNETDTQVHIWDRLPASARRLLESLGTTGPIEYTGFRVSPNSFFQVNRYLVDDLVTCAVADSGGEWAVDLYAGVGLFSARLAQTFKRVTAVESSRRAFHDLRFNMERRELQVTAENQPAEDYLTGLRQTPELILADPPRTGLGKYAVRELLRIRAPQLAIVSCDPATLARDLQGLLAGGYHMRQITLVDLFPQTFHVETVVHLVAQVSDLRKTFSQNH